MQSTTEVSNVGQIDTHMRQLINGLCKKSDPVIVDIFLYNLERLIELSQSSNTSNKMEVILSISNYLLTFERLINIEQMHSAKGEFNIDGKSIKLILSFIDALKLECPKFVDYFTNLKVDEIIGQEIFYTISNNMAIIYCQNYMPKGKAGNIESLLNQLCSRSLNLNFKEMEPTKLLNSLHGCTDYGRPMCALNFIDTYLQELFTPIILEKLLDEKFGNLRNSLRESINNSEHSLYAFLRFALTGHRSFFETDETQAVDTFKDYLNTGHPFTLAYLNIILKDIEPQMLFKALTTDDVELGFYYSEVGSSQKYIVVVPLIFNFAVLGEASEAIIRVLEKKPVELIKLIDFLSKAARDNKMYLLPYQLFVDNCIKCLVKIKTKDTALLKKIYGYKQNNFCIEANPVLLLEGAPSHNNNEDKQSLKNEIQDYIGSLQEKMVKENSLSQIDLYMHKINVLSGCIDILDYKNVNLEQIKMKNPRYNEGWWGSKTDELSKKVEDYIKKVQPGNTSLKSSNKTDDKDDGFKFF